LRSMNTHKNIKYLVPTERKRTFGFDLEGYGDSLVTVTVYKIGKVTVTV
jgi:hypothetical protein